MFKKHRLAVATTVYWFLLAYIIVGLAWWFIALNSQNNRMAGFKLQELKMDDPHYMEKASGILAEQQRRAAGYIGEGSTFLLLILVAAIFVYREVRRQIRLQQQQQNFMMAVTHELKTPIAVAKLNLETLQKHRLDEAKQQRIISAAIQETDRLDNLANNILIASQLEGGGYNRSKEPVDLSGLVGEAVESLRHRFPTRNWVDGIAPDCGIVGDPVLLRMLVNNLAENAVKYTPKEGAITIRLGLEGSRCILSVADEGPGIPDHEKKKIFHKFYRTGSEGTRKTQGTGLGLYLCRKIAADHQAVIKVVDNSPVGANFMVIFKTKGVNS